MWQEDATEKTAKEHGALKKLEGLHEESENQETESDQDKESDQEKEKEKEK